MDLINELLLEQMLQAEIDCIISDANDVSDARLKKALCYYKFLSNNIESLASLEGKSKVLYAKYYWYTQYKKRYFEVFGYDAGIEQEAYKVLEEIESKLEDGVNWSVIQQIEEDCN